CLNPAADSGRAEGSHNCKVRAKDAAGNMDPTPANFNWTIDLTAPDAIIDSKPLDPTNITSATFAFHATEADSTLGCSLDGGAFATCTSPATYNGLLDGPHAFKVRAKDQAGNQGNEASFNWTIDTQAPDTLIDTTPAKFTNSNTATFAFHATEGSTFTCQLDNQTPGACTSPVTYNGLDDGSHTFTVTATDTAGNADQNPASFTWVIDTVKPDTQITAGPADGSTTTATTATFDLTGSDDVTTSGNLTFECSLDGADFAPCTSPVNYTNLGRAEHTFQVRAKDQAGNVDSSLASRTWTIEKLTPVITWATPVDITYPTALSGTQLNATADAAGSFVYSPVAGTVLNAGSGQTLSVTFTPTDTTNYKTAGKTVQINVLKAKATITVNGFSGVYDGAEHGASGSATGVNSEDLSRLLHLGATYTKVPRATPHCTFDGNTNYKSTSGDLAITISQADATIAVNGYTGVYDGNAHGATGSATGVKSENLTSLLHLGASFANVSGGTAHWTFDGDTN